MNREVRGRGLYKAAPSRPVRKEKGKGAMRGEWEKDIREKEGSFEN